MHPLYTPVREDRTFDWSTAIAKTILGAWLMFPSATIDPWLTWSVAWFSELWLGVAILIAGIVETGFLIINGKADWTPIARVRASLLSLVPLGALFVVTLNERPMGLGVLLSLLFIGRTYICIRRAAEDATHIEERRNVGIPH